MGMLDKKGLSAIEECGIYAEKISSGYYEGIITYEICNKDY